LRDFIHVLDAVDATLHVFDQGGKGGLYNIGTGKARSWKDMMLSLFQALGREPKIQYIDMPLVLQGKYQYFTEADNRKLIASGFKQEMRSLEKGIEEYAGYLVRGFKVLGD
jgi:ADP-L-glycero-D-manno-heptose 6-epimerase